MSTEVWHLEFSTTVLVPRKKKKKEKKCKTVLNSVTSLHGSDVTCILYTGTRSSFDDHELVVRVQHVHRKTVIIKLHHNFIFFLLLFITT